MSSLLNARFQHFVFPSIFYLFVSSNKNDNHKTNAHLRYPLNYCKFESSNCCATSKFLRMISTPTGSWFWFIRSRLWCDRIHLRFEGQNNLNIFKSRRQLQPIHLLYWSTIRSLLSSVYQLVRIVRRYQSNALRWVNIAVGGGQPWTRGCCSISAWSRWNSSERHRSACHQDRQFIHHHGSAGPTAVSFISFLYFLCFLSNIFFRLNGEDEEQCYPFSFNFSTTLTPMILAGLENNHDMVRLLVKRGHAPPQTHRVKCMLKLNILTWKIINMNW